MSDVENNLNDKPSPADATEPAANLQAQLAEKMMGVFDIVIADRTAYYDKNPDKIPNKDSVDFIIQSYSAKNAAISGGVSLVPGPLGMIAAVPEIMVVMRNQIAMIDDIGRAHGKSRVVTKELLAGILLTAMGGSSTALLTIHGGKVVVKRVALRVFQRIIHILGGKVSQQLLKSMVSKYVPFLGAAAMAAWSHYMTRKVGQKAIEIFQKDIEISNEIIEELPLLEDKSIVSDTNEIESSNASTASIVNGLKVGALINLMKVDGSIKVEERGYLQTILDKGNLTAMIREDLAQAIESDQRLSIDFSTLASTPDEAIGLLVDLVALAHRDGTFHITEKMYIKQAGKLMGFADDDVEAIMSTTD